MPDQKSQPDHFLNPLPLVSEQRLLPETEEIRIEYNIGLDVFSSIKDTKKQALNQVNSSNSFVN